ncbi:unnamed protein product [Paramecium sonneborni]|uniref:Uncharacterized protein n=1 Tax=Paramecium sonneborni TaxID=65129 RepID=A0A8S1NXQ2_9CILI|nr:unnamed protein product [Paramecium sonneborni]
MYIALVLKNYYMPDLSSSVITCENLLNVALGKCFRILSNEVKIGYILKRVTKVNLYYELKKFQSKEISIQDFHKKRFPDQCFVHFK